MMKSLLAIFGVIVVAGGFALSAQTSSPPTSTDAVAALVSEVRALRTELAQVASASVRSQLLVTRVQLQEQRLMHLDRQRAEVSVKLGDAERMRTMFAGQVKQLQTQSTHSGDAKEREAAQPMIEGMKNQLEAARANETSLRAEEGALLNALSTEQSRWSEFNSRLDELERSLPAKR